MTQVFPALHSPLALPLIFINLDADSARRLEFEAAFEAIGAFPRRLAATRWARLSKAEQNLFYSDHLNTGSYFRPLVDGEKGCYMSHVQIWRGLLASDDRAWIVLEDDVIPASGFADAVNAIAKLPDGWDMVKLIGREHERILQSWPLDSRFNLISYRRVPSLTAGYVISRNGARRLLDTRVPFGRPIDVDLRLWWENGMVIRGVMPAPIALAANGGSSIGAREDRIGVTQRWRKFVFKLRYTVANWCAFKR